MSDYERIAKAISYVTSKAGQQPLLEEIASHINLSPYHFQRLFARWTGVTPKRYLQVLTVERAKRLLDESKALLAVSEEVGLSSSSRLYDHFVQLEAVTPGEYKKQGEGLKIEYAVHATPFGNTFIAMTGRGICKLSFLDTPGQDSELNVLRETWPKAELLESRENTSMIIDSIFHMKQTADRPLSLMVSGTNFQIKVWKALLEIPPGSVSTYSEVAELIGSPKAARAVGSAIALNPVAFLIPCHRVIQKSGKLGGYHWGEERLHAIHAWETARNE